MRHRRVNGKEQVFEACSKYIIQGDPRDNKGMWKKSIFENDNPIWLEIGSGKGQFLSSQAKLHPEVNFLACEGLPDVYVRICEKILDMGLTNLRVIPCFMDDATEFFEEKELDRIFINFCDPWPKKKHIKRRLTNREKLSAYFNVLGPGKLYQLKTDNGPLFEFSVAEADAVGFETLEISRDLHSSPYSEKNIPTEYEDKFANNGITINYLLCKTPEKLKTFTPLKELE